MTDRVHPEHDDPGEATGGLELVISRVLRLGVAASLTFMVIGIVVGFIDGSLSGGRRELDALIDPDVASHTFGLAWESLRVGGARGFMVLGIGVLVATPMVRVLVSLVGYARSRDWIYLGLTVAVVAALAVSMALGATH
ncbi:MAG: DUF1634 domain-containing protein [Actinobacteria bacterium]|nr:DUF1634 domain-containing protein [Actinomycetota bacterium]